MGSFGRIFEIGKLHLGAMFDTRWVPEGEAEGIRYRLPKDVLQDLRLTIAFPRNSPQRDALEGWTALDEGLRTFLTLLGGTELSVSASPHGQGLEIKVPEVLALGAEILTELGISTDESVGPVGFAGS